MASTTAATMVKAVVVAVLLMQCCDVILSARPLLNAAAGTDGGWQTRGATGRQATPATATATIRNPGTPAAHRRRLLLSGAAPAHASSFVVQFQGKMVL
jgi:hypothetical protein